MLPIIIKFVNCAILIASQANVCLERMSLLVFNVQATSFYLMELALILPVPNIITKELEIKLAIRVIEAGNNNKIICFYLLIVSIAWKKQNTIVFIVSQIIIYKELLAKKRENAKNVWIIRAQMEERPAIAFNAIIRGKNNNN